MKKMICLLISACMILCLGGCQKGNDQPELPENTDKPENQVSSENAENQESGDKDEMRPLTFEKSLHSYYEWTEDNEQLLVRSKHSIVTLGQEAAQEYPEMAEVLNQIATMQENTMLDEFDNLVSFANERISINRDTFETYVSTLDVQVRRADSLVISLLNDTYSHYEQIENFRVWHGSNYDTKTGKELMLNDVVEVNNDLALTVQKELTERVWTGDFYSETVVEDYFANTPYDGFNWTMDYIGLTFYFLPGELCDDGIITATISFAEHPEFFNEKYMTVPSEYIVELPFDISFFTELDTEKTLEAISVSGWYNDEEHHYLDYGVYTDTDGQYYSEECYLYDLHPYFVKTEKGNYVYLFREELEDNQRQMSLVVFTLNADGSVTKSGEMSVSPSWLAENKYIIPTNPSKLILDDATNGTSKIEFTVGENGMPNS